MKQEIEQYTKAGGSGISGCFHFSHIIAKHSVPSISLYCEHSGTTNDMDTYRHIRYVYTVEALVKWPESI